MRKKITSKLIALLVILGGVLLILHATGVIQLTLFKGWWTLFIILPTLISMIGNRINSGHFFFLGLGVILLLNANGLLAGMNVWLLIIGLLVVTIGLGILFSRHASSQPKVDQSDKASYWAVFSGNEAQNSSKDFKGADLTAIFGGLELDLRGAYLTGDAQINCTAVFGGIEVYVPANFNVVVSGTPIFGGYNDGVKRSGDPSLPTLYINCFAAFGGVDVLEQKKS